MQYTYGRETVTACPVLLWIIESLPKIGEILQADIRTSQYFMFPGPDGNELQCEIECERELHIQIELGEGFWLNYDLDSADAEPQVTVTYVGKNANLAERLKDMGQTKLGTIVDLPLRLIGLSTLLISPKAKDVDYWEEARTHYVPMNVDQAALPELKAA